MTPQPTPEPVKESARWRSHMAALWMNGDKCVGLALHTQSADQIAHAHNAAVEALERVRDKALAKCLELSGEVDTLTGRVIVRDATIERLKGLLERAGAIVNKVAIKSTPTLVQSKEAANLASEILAEIGGDAG